MGDDDSDLFRRSVDIDKQVQYDGVKPARASLPIVAKQRLEDEKRVIDEMFSEGFEPADLETGEELGFFRPGVSNSVFRKLRRGQLSIQGELDLHGLRVAEAKTVLAQYLHDCLRLEKRCVRIIHGKGHGSLHGQPVIKNKVNVWLRQRDEVLAFCTARQTDGGTGAIYVLLKKT
jgi:DNA-nicking Smr family endonuclease